MPRSVPCPTCGQMFLPSGLRFHAKVCQKRQREMITSCPYCQLEMPQISLDGHIATCKAARRSMQSMQKASTLNGTGWKPTSVDDTAHFMENISSDGRTSCRFCGRKFINARIHQHSSICGRLRQARPASLGGVRTQLPARVYNSAAARTTFFGSFERARQRMFIPRAAAENQGILVRCAGVARKIGSRAAATLRPWTVLGVSRHANTAEVRAAYHKLAKEWHPDRHPTDSKAEAEVRFKSIAEAYEAMARPKRRKPKDRGRLALTSGSWRGKHDDFVSTRCARGVSTREPSHRKPLLGRRPKPPLGRSQSSQAPVKELFNKQRDPMLGSHQGLRCNGSSSSSPDLAEGMSVCIEGLSNSKHLNGTTGVLRVFDEKAGRWHVELIGNQVSEVAVRAENLRSLPRRLSGLKSTCQSGPIDGARYLPKTRPTTSIPSLKSGAKARLKGLSGAAHLNGIVGTLQHFDSETLRWHVELSSGETKAVRLDNLEAL